MSANQTFGPTPDTLAGLPAYKLGQDALERSKEHFGKLAAHEKARRERSNESEIESLKFRYSCCSERRKELRDVIRLAPPADISSLCWLRWRFWGFAILFVTAGMFFAHLTLAPFGLGGEEWLFSAGLAFIGAFSTERMLEELDCEALIRTLCILAFLCSIAGILIMALVRGDVLALYLHDAFTDGATQVQDATAVDFYSHAVPKLQLFMALLAVAMELACGIAAFKAEKCDVSCLRRAEAAKTELHDVENEMFAIVARATHLKNDPQMHENQIYRDFYLGIMDAIQKTGLLPLFAAGLGLWLLLSIPVRAANGSESQQPAAVDVVIDIDATQSVGGREYDGKTAYEKNIETALHLIAALPAGARVTVLVISDRSFAQPYILVQQQLPRDRGPLQFLDRVATTKSQIAKEVREASTSLPPRFPHTDIFGACIVSADILHRSTGEKVLILLSDMRESIPGLDFERPLTMAVQETLWRAQREGIVADLKGIDVYVLGVDAIGKTVGYWNSLREFWMAYFAQAGGNVRLYSMLREASAVFPIHP